MEENSEADHQIKEGRRRIKTAEAKIRKLSKQVEAEKNNILFWRIHIEETEDNGLG